MKKPLVLCILDGCGITQNTKGNAFYHAYKKNFTYLASHYPYTTLDASGEFVGLPAGQMGNSEVGHMNIGAGKIVYQPQELINQEIKNEQIYQNKNILKAINHTKENNSSLHILGLLSDGGIHSHINHLFAIMNMCKKENVKEIYFHLFTDGRDTDVHSAKKYFKILEEKIKELNLGIICTISGRYYAMDRDNNYDRIKLSYDCIVNNVGPKFNNPEELLNHYYEENITDEFIIPSIINEHPIEKNDGVIVFNYRPDRLRELCTALTNYQEVPFNAKELTNIAFVSMMPINETVKGLTAYKHQEITEPLGVYLAELGLNQLRIAETEKYAHVTYFFDGGKELELKNAKRILVNSPKVPTYDLTPHMSAEEITDKLIAELKKDYLDVVILNFANGDMLGHTGNFEAAKKGVEFVDICLGRIMEMIKNIDGTLIVTADHGNCEVMENPDGTICTTHTTNKVPFIITKNNISLKENGKLADIAPTILDLLNIEKPDTMTGTSLIKED